MSTNLSNTPQYQFTTDFNLTDVLKIWKKDIFLSMNCHAIGTIESFKKENQTASASIAYQKVFFRSDPETQAYAPYLLPYPVLIDCPVICLGGGEAALTFPIQVGDECLILFNDRDMDNWFASNPGGAPQTGRTHSFTDGFILVGIRSIANVLSDYDSTRAILRNGTAALGVRRDTSKVLITNNYPASSVTLNSILQSILSELTTLTTLLSALTVTGVSAGGGTSGPPSSAAAITAVGTQLTTLASSLGALLE